jgi:chromate reductase, NAD(P)H dehydrogenase (quinone)
MQVPPTQPLRILAVSGSLRAGSYNRLLLEAVAELAPDALQLEPFDLDGIPLYDADDEQRDTPAAVTRLTDALRAADGLLIATPEYNASIPGVLKNAIDWASRPPQPTALVGLPTGILGAAAGMSGSMRAQAHLRLVLGHTNTPVLLKPEVYVTKPGQKFGADGALTDEETRAILQRFLTAFEAFVHQMAPLRPQSVPASR